MFVSFSFTAPYGIATLGYVGGSILYAVMGLIFVYTSLLLLKLYVFYNDQKHLRTYGELLERVLDRYGEGPRLAGKWVFVVLQIFQLWLNGAVAALGSAQALYQVSNNSICFYVFTAIYCTVATLICSMRELKSLGFVSLLAMLINIFICFATIGVAATTGYFNNIHNAAPSSLLQSGFVPTNAKGDGLYAPQGTAFVNYISLDAVMNGVSTMVYAYAGATVFVEIMAEMKEPRDFRKSFLFGMALIITLYLCFGLGVYAEQGPYAGNPANQGLVVKSWQDTLNIITVLALFVSGSIYMSVGMKVFYAQILVDLFHCAPLPTRQGMFNWVWVSIGFWWSAFVLAESIPQFSAFSGIVSALVMIHFSFTLPPFMNLMHQLKEDNKLADGSDGKISFMVHITHNWPRKLLDTLIVLCSLCLCGMGTWGSILTLLSAISDGSTSVFGCNGA